MIGYIVFPKRNTQYAIFIYFSGPKKDDTWKWRTLEETNLRGPYFLVWEVLMDVNDTSFTAVDDITVCPGKCN